MLNAVYNFAKQAKGGSALTLSKSLGASCELWGNPPSLALDVTLIQHLPGRTPRDKSYWIYIYLKARGISHTKQLPTCPTRSGDPPDFGRISQATADTIRRGFFLVFFTLKTEYSWSYGRYHACLRFGFWCRQSNSRHVLGSIVWAICRVVPLWINSSSVE